MPEWENFLSIRFNAGESVETTPGRCLRGRKTSGAADRGRVAWTGSVATGAAGAIRPAAESITVEAKTLDTIAREAGITALQALVGDAEGAEPEVLQGGTSLLEHTKYVGLDCSSERRGQDTYAVCADMLRATGFEILPRRHPRKYLTARNLRLTT